MTDGRNATAAMLGPLADGVGAKPLGSEEMTRSAILLPATAKEKPMRGIVGNAGPDAGVAMELVRRAQREQHNSNIGYDVLAEQDVDMLGAGVIAPAKVLRSAVEHAASIAAMILPTEALISDKPGSRRVPPATA